MAETAQCHAAWAALIDNGGNPRTHANEVRIEAKPACNMLVDMPVSIDQPRCYNAACYVNFSGCRNVWPEPGRHVRDPPVGDGDVQHLISFCKRINYRAGAQDQVNRHYQTSFVRLLISILIY